MFVRHRDHDPTNNDASNLAALCQRCYTLHAREEHIRRRRLTYLARRAASPKQVLFCSTTVRSDDAERATEPDRESILKGTPIMRLDHHADGNKFASDLMAFLIRCPNRSIVSAWATERCLRSRPLWPGA